MDRCTVHEVVRTNHESETRLGSADGGVAPIGEISEAGYHSIINADVAVGKPYPFSAEFSYDDHPAAPVEVVVRPFNGPVTAVLQPIVISSIPSQ